MKRLGYLSIATTLLLTQANGFEFQSVGYESTSMGGAGVTNARGSMAPYYNPALLAKSKYDTEVSLGGSLGLRDNGAVEALDNLADNDIAQNFSHLTQDLDNQIENMKNPGEIFDNITDISTYINASNQSIVLDAGAAAPAQAIQNSLDDMANLNGKGLSFQPSAYASIQVGNFGLAILSTTDSSASLLINKDYLGLYVKAGDSTDQLYAEYNTTGGANGTGTYTLTSDSSNYDNHSLEIGIEEKHKLVIESFVLNELPISYATQYQTNWGDVSLGGSIKLLNGIYTSQNIGIETDIDTLIDQFSESTKSSNSVGVDLGLIYDPEFKIVFDDWTLKFDNLSLGITAKNINNPTFEKTDGSDFIVDRQVRVGANYEAWDMVDIAIDYDVTKNPTLISGQESQWLGGGVNFRPLSWLSVRAGAMKNQAIEADGTIYTAGVGFGMKWFQLDMSAQFNDNIKDLIKDFDNADKNLGYNRFNIALISRW